MINYANQTNYNTAYELIELTWIHLDRERLTKIQLKDTGKKLYFMDTKWTGAAA